MPRARSIFLGSSLRFVREFVPSSCHFNKTGAVVVVTNHLGNLQTLSCVSTI